MVCDTLIKTQTRAGWSQESRRNQHFSWVTALVTARAATERSLSFCKGLQPLSFIVPTVFDAKIYLWVYSPLLGLDCFFCFPMFLHSQ
jgi:hypothetical protein